jgi:hypothetical protein
MRVRHIKENELHFFVDPTPYKETEPYMTREQIDVRERAKLSDQRDLFGGKSFTETSNLWYQIYLDALEERNHSMRKIIEMFDYFLEQCNYVVSEASEEDDVEELIEQIEGEIEYDYSMIPNLTYPEMLRLKTQEMSRGPKSKKLTDLEKVSLRKWGFDCTIPFVLPEQRRAVMWSVYQRLGHLRWSNLRVELGLLTGQLTWDDILREGRRDLWNDGFERKTLTMEGIIRMFDLTNTVEEQKLTRAGIESMMKSEEYLELESYGQRAFGIVDQSSEKTKKKVTFKRVKQFLASCLEKWSGASLESDKRDRKQVNGVRKTISGLTLTPIEQGLVTDVIPRGVKELEANRIYTFRMLNDEKLRVMERDRLARRLLFEQSQERMRKEALV